MPQWSVKPQDNFKNVVTGTTGISLIVIVVVIILAIIIWKLVSKNKPVVPVMDQPKDVNRIKTEYLAKIDNLITKINNQAITKRKAYNELSLIIREFIYKTTDIDVLKYTLYEAKYTNKKELVELMNEYYEPEFSKEGKGDLTESINKTRKVIVEWK